MALLARFRHEDAPNSPPQVNVYVVMYALSRGCQSVSSGQAMTLPADHAHRDPGLPAAPGSEVEEGVLFPLGDRLAERGEVLGRRVTPREQAGRLRLEARHDR